MTIWIFAVLLIGSVAVTGWRMGAIRAAISFVGIFIAMLLAGLAGKIFEWLLPHIGVPNPLYVYMLAPVFGFFLIMILVKMAAFKVHFKVDIHYRHKTGDLRLGLWQRLNSRLGLCVGLLNGSIYFLLACCLILNVSYWTAQAATPAKPQSTLVRLVNRMGHDLETTGVAQPAAAMHSYPPGYYRWADLVGLLMSSPDTGTRVADYPGLTSLWQRPDMQDLVNDSNVTNSLAADTTMFGVIGQPSVQNLLMNKDMFKLVLGTVETNFDDFTNYLQTGTSAKFGGEKIIGQWVCNVNVTMAWLRQSQPKIQAAEMGAIRTLWTQAYSQMNILATGDNQIFIKNIPQFKKPPTAPELSNWNGDWSVDGNTYTLHVTLNGEDKFLSATVQDLRMSVKDGRNLLIFDRAN